MDLEKYAIRIKKEHKIDSGYDSIIKKIRELNRSNKAVIIECYPGTNEDLIIEKILKKSSFDQIINSKCFLIDEDKTESILKYNITDDRIFGRLSLHTLYDFKNDSFEEVQETIMSDLAKGQKIAIIGSGSYLFEGNKTSIYVDLTRWEIQNRYKDKSISNFNASNAGEDPLRMIKRGYFVDWPIADRFKKRNMQDMDYYLDIMEEEKPMLLSIPSYMEALSEVVNQPFSVVPFYDSGVWGGKWLQEKFGIYKDKENIAWSFNGVPEENSLVLKIGDEIIETPANNLVFFESQSLLGENVESRFGKNFPIRFNFLDTMGGQNLSLQVHPKTDYLQDTFGLHYTQDESYYVLEADPEAVVYLGLNEGTTENDLTKALIKSQNKGEVFDDRQFINRIPMKKHDHFSIPSGTIHSSGKNSVVLEISATPNRFTFKLWDWGRVDFDGLPRPVHLNHGFPNIDYYKTTTWVNRYLVNPIETIIENDNYIEERTGLYKTEFLETRRHTSKVSVLHENDNGVNVLNLVDGKGAVITSDFDEFEPFEVDYAQTVIIPSKIMSYRISPKNERSEIKTIKAYVRKY